MIKKISTTILLTIILSLTFCMSSAFAFKIDDSYAPDNTPFTDNDTFDFKSENAETATIKLLQMIAGALLFFAAPLAVIMIAWAALDMVIGGAESEKLEQSKKHLTWTIIGLILIIISYSAVRFVLTIVVDADIPASTAAGQPAPATPAPAAPAAP